jgi:hypothetical protein
MQRVALPELGRPGRMAFTAALGQRTPADLFRQSEKTKSPGQIAADTLATAFDVRPIIPSA